MNVWFIGLFGFLGAVIAIGIPLVLMYHDRIMDKHFKHWAADHEIDTATYDTVKELMTIIYKSGRVAKFKGSGTVWYSYPLMERCWTPMEARLCDINRYIEEHGNPYPIAHQIV